MTTPHEVKDKEKAAEKHEITLTVQTGRGSADFEVAQTTKVADLIAKVIERFDYPANGVYSLVKETEVLAPERTLISYHLADQTILQLSETGGGV